MGIKKPGHAWTKSGSGQMKLGLQIPTSINWGMRTAIQSICAPVNELESIGHMDLEGVVKWLGLYGRDGCRSEFEGRDRASCLVAESHRWRFNDVDDVAELMGNAFFGRNIEGCLSLGHPTVVTTFIPSFRWSLPK